MKLGPSDVDTTVFQRDIELARQVHLSTLPEPFQEERLEMALRYQPAVGFGGDYCSVHRAGGRSLITVCDVSGHGIAAALMVGRINTFLKEKAADHPSPGRLTAVLDRFVTANFGKLGMFLSFFAAEFDPGPRRFSWCGSGHPPAIWASAREKRAVRLESSQPPVGFDLPGRGSPSETAVVMAPGDRVLLYTDGATEARDPQGAFFGLEALERHLWDSRALPVEDLAGLLHGRVVDHARGRPHDDVLLLLLGIR